MTTPDDTLRSVLQEAARRLDVSLQGEVAFGWGKKSIGSRTADGRWLHLRSRLIADNPGSSWVGDEASIALKPIKKPMFLESFTWIHEKTSYKASLLTLANSPSVSPTPHITTTIQLPETWWEDLQQTLLILESHSTPRVNVRQELITRRIRELIDVDIDSEVQNWTTAHGDVHWANLTAPEFGLLDWEGWGVAPAGLDAAYLLCFSLHQPEVAREVASRLEGLLGTRDGRLSQLFAAAELLRMARAHGDHPELVPHLKSHVESLIKQQ